MNTTEMLVQELIDRLGPDAVATDAASRATASHDYAWLSPILVEDLPETVADIVVRPTSADDIPFVLAAAHRHRIPVTPRGRGTGNYGQAVPLQQGLVLDLTRCDRIRSIDGDVADVEAGVTFSQLEAAAEQHGLEVAVMPSMVGSTVGGFLAGGNQGIGSIEHGSIWDGWVRGLDVVGCHSEPNAISVDGAAIASHLHSYGTAGVISGARLQLAPRRMRIVLFAAFDEFGDAARAGRAMMDLTPAPRIISLDDPGLGPTLPQHGGIEAGASMLRAAITPDSVDDVTSIVAGHSGRVTAVDERVMSSLYSSIYNHATLRAKRADQRVCALQVRGWAVIDHGEAVRAVLPDVRIHLDGNAPVVHGKGYSGLLLSSWVDRATLTAGIAALQALGVQVISPHTWVLGGHGNVDRLRVVTPTVDPDGLLNPGKLPAMIDDPAAGVPAAAAPAAADLVAVLSAAHAYERALVSGDGAAAATFFADDASTSRFGPDGAQFGVDEVRALRASYAPVPEPVWLHDEARPVAPGVVLHLALMRRGDAVVQRTQVWTRRGTTWTIAHAHVSRVAP